ncbi:MAG: DUF6364 family protein [Trueperaceae bacterium]|nr:DUF6364 family protein [Trueperaceae bacterium]
MTTKLTLRMDEHLTEVAKRHAATHDTSVSRMVAAYFEALEALSADAERGALPAPSDRLRALVGVLPSEPEPEKAYRAYLEVKHA